MPIESVLFLIQTKLRQWTPFEFTWLGVLAEYAGDARKDIEKLARNFTWRRLLNYLWGLAFSLLLLWIFWDVVMGFREIGVEIALIFAKIDIAIFLVFLPFILFFSSLECIGVIIDFLARPQKKRVRLLVRSVIACAVLWAVYLVNSAYEEQIQAFIDSV